MHDKSQKPKLLHGVELYGKLALLSCTCIDMQRTLSNSLVDLAARVFIATLGNRLVTCFDWPVLNIWF